MIQSFAPGEITPEQAHEIGMKLAEEVLGGKYEFVISTHTDRGHIHNHIIFNSVSVVDYKKYHSNKSITRKRTQKALVSISLPILNLINQTNMFLFVRDDFTVKNNSNDGAILNVDIKTIYY